MINAAFHRNALQSERLHRLGLRYFVSAVFAGAPGIVVPEIEHRLAEMLDDVAAIEIDVFHERAAVIAIKDDVFVFAGGAAPFHDDADGVWRTDRRVHDVRRNEERFSFPHEMIDDAVAFADPHFDVAFELVKIFFRIDLMKIVPGVRAFDDHDKKVAPVVKVAIADRRLKQLAVRFDPVVDVDRRQNLCGRAGADLFRGR